ncbi:MAG TPA: hypothetical protein VFF20_08480 [Pseudogracilibacillus sp.]|nr:hypothetical protein [Pseudogracilibacillus sp.]
MEENYLFYWLSWLLIIIVYFFMKKSWQTYFFLSILFILIMTVNVQVNVFAQLSVNIAFIIALLTAFLYYAHFTLSTYHLLTSFMFIFAYVALLLWGKISPVWFIMDLRVMIPLILASLLIFVCKDANLRLATALFGVLIGQFIFDLILIRYRLHMQIGSLFSFNMLYTIIVMLLISYLISESLHYLKQKLMY